jgi:hypothetical protein
MQRFRRWIRNEQINSRKLDEFFGGSVGWNVGLVAGFTDVWSSGNGDPSLRLKNAFTQDDKKESECFFSLLSL